MSVMSGILVGTMFGGWGAVEQMVLVLQVMLTHDKFSFRSQIVARRSDSYYDTIFCAGVVGYL